MLGTYVFQQRQDVQRHKREILRGHNRSGILRQILRNLERLENVDGSVDEGISGIGQARGQRSIHGHFGQQTDDALRIGRVHHFRQARSDGNTQRVDANSPFGFATGVQQRRLEAYRFDVGQAFFIGDLRMERIRLVCVKT